MNASFRTAFWAMCLGLTVPMLLFIGVEMISPGSASRKTAVVAADRTESLKTRLHATAAKPATRRSPTGRQDPRAATTPMPADARSKLATSPVPETPFRDAPEPARTGPESAEPQIVLGPELETDLATSDAEPASAEPGSSDHRSDHRVPAVAAHTRPKVRILPDIEPLPASGDRTAAAIEERLAGIQINLDKIGRTLDAQTLRDQVLKDQVQRENVQREPLVDPVKQVTELLKQLQEVRQRDHPPVPLEGPVSRKPADENHDSAGARPQPVTRIYRPRYLTGSALQSLVEPLLTRDLGKTGAADAETVEAGPGSSSGSPANALVVHDLPQVMRKIDQLVAKLDVPPIQVVLEAVVITLQLNADLPQGIDLREFNAAGQPFSVSPVDAGSSSPASGGLPLTSGFGLKCGKLTGDPQAFISALEAASQVRSTRAWQMTVVNRQSAVLMLNDPFGPPGTGNQSAAGTILKIRPIVDRTGLVQLDVRREVDRDGTASGSRAAALTNQITLRDGQTAVVGGFFAEQTALQFYRPSGIGQLPLVGGLFRKQFEAVEHCETIVLLTPHVIASTADTDSQVVRKPKPSSRHAGATVRASHAVSAGEARRGRK